MTDKEALEKLDHTLCLNSQLLKFSIDDKDHIDCKDVYEMISCIETIAEALDREEKQNKILEEIRNTFKVIDYGEEYQNRYALQAGDVIYPINKITYDIWNRWLTYDK